MKKLILILITCVLYTGLHGQEMDPERMNRDMKIAEDIIATLYKNESSEGHFYSVRPKATYVEGFGVMINVTNNNHFYSESFGKSFNFQWEDGADPFVVDVDVLEDLEVQVEQLAMEAEELAREHMKNEELSEKQAKALKMKEQELEIKAQKVEPKMKKKAMKESHDRNQHVVVIKTEQNQEEIIDEVRDLNRKVMITFLTDYADLIGQLDDKEKIMMTTEFGGNGFGNAMAGSERTKFSALVIRDNLTAYKQGKINKEKFVDTIEFSEAGGTTKSPDLELLSSIFERLYKVDLATTYYCSYDIPYERMDQFGVIFKMKVYSSTSHGRDNHKISTTGQSGLTMEERNEIVNGMYPKFVEELKGNMLDYGKTIKSLDADETVIMQVRLTECKGCSMPKQVDLSIPAGVLQNYNTGKIKRADAMKKFNVKESR